MLLRQLEYILAVEKFQSFTKAADFCCVTQPTLSQQIKTLENYLGIEIFNRSSLPILPTRNGKLILNKAVEIVEKAKSLEVLAKDIVKKQQLSVL